MVLRYVTSQPVFVIGAKHDPVAAMAAADIDSSDTSSALRVRHQLPLYMMMGRELILVRKMTAGT